MDHLNKKLIVGEWFKLPSNCSKKLVSVKIVSKGTGRKKAKHGKKSHESLVK